MDIVKTIDVPPDGDCLFHSLALLFSKSDLHKTLLTNLYLNKELREMHNEPPLSATGIRAIIPWVLQTNTDIGKTMREYIGNIISLYRSTPIIASEYPYLPHIVKGNKVHISLLMNKNVYWGDDMAIRILESVFKTRFIILCDKNNIYHDNKETYNFSIMLRLVGQHYQAAYIQTQAGKDVFFFDESTYKDIANAFKNKLIKQL